MGVTIEREGDNLGVLRITGLLRKPEFDAALTAEVNQWGPTTRVKVLVIVEDFKGWEHGADWGDMITDEKGKEVRYFHEPETGWWRRLSVKFLSLFAPEKML